MKKLFLRAEFGPLWEPWEEDEIGRKALVSRSLSVKKIYRPSSCLYTTSACSVAVSPLLYTAASLKVVSGRGKTAGWFKQGEVMTVMTSPRPAFQECTGSWHANVPIPKVISSDMRSTDGLTVLAQIEIVAILV
jgi:hypothetical protein